MLLINGLKDINRALSKPLRFLIMVLIISAVSVVVLLCCIVYWQRGDMKRKDARIDRIEKEIVSKDIQINGLYDKLLKSLVSLNVETKRELEEIKRKK